MVCALLIAHQFSSTCRTKFWHCLRGPQLDRAAALWVLGDSINHCRGRGGHSSHSTGSKFKRYGSDRVLPHFV